MFGKGSKGLLNSTMTCISPWCRYSCGRTRWRKAVMPGRRKSSHVLKTHSRTAWMSLWDADLRSPTCAWWSPYMTMATSSGISAGWARRRTRRSSQSSMISNGSTGSPAGRGSTAASSCLAPRRSVASWSSSVVAKLGWRTRSIVVAKTDWALPLLGHRTFSSNAPKITIRPRLHMERMARAKPQYFLHKWQMFDVLNLWLLGGIVVDKNFDDRPRSNGMTLRKGCNMTLDVNIARVAMNRMTIGSSTGIDQSLIPSLHISNVCWSRF